jgi:hypothetical protein
MCHVPVVSGSVAQGERESGRMGQEKVETMAPRVSVTEFVNRLLFLCNSNFSSFAGPGIAPHKIMLEGD